MRPSIDQQVTFLYTNDLEQSADFYANILQLPLILDQGACRIYRTSRDSFLGICKTDEPIGTVNVIVTLVSTEVDKWHAYLLEKKIHIEKPPTLYEKFNIYHLFVRDPNGYLIEIQTFLDIDWPTT